MAINNLLPGIGMAGGIQLGGMGMGMEMGMNIGGMEMGMSMGLGGMNMSMGMGQGMGIGQGPQETGMMRPQPHHHHHHHGRPQMNPLQMIGQLLKSMIGAMSGGQGFQGGQQMGMCMCPRQGQFGPAAQVGVVMGAFMGRGF